MGALIETDGLSKQYGGKAALADVSLRLDGGHTVALLGHNGAGKTTLIKLLLGLTRPTMGSARVLDCDPAGRQAAKARRHVGYLPENLSFQLNMSGRELLRFYAGLKRAGAGQIDDLLQAVNLTEAADRRTATYSKGMRQRLGLAQALLGTPKLLFLDEPTNGLDPPLRRQFYDVVGRITAAGATAIISSHVLTEIEARADLIAILRHGRLVAFGSLDDLRLQSGLPFRLRMAVRSDAVGRVAETLGHEYALIRRDDDTVEFACATADKMRIIKQVATFNGMVRDVDVLPPRLDDVYEYFVPDEESAGEAVR